MPRLRRVAMMWNRNDLGMSQRYETSASAAQSIGVTVLPLGVREDFNGVFEALDREPPEAILMVADTLTILNRKRVYDYAGAHRIPAPKPPSVDEIKNALRPGEALLSYYFGQNASFVWAVPKDGDVAFASVPATALELEAKVRRLRQALEPQVSMVSEIPPFDVALGYELYALLLKPVEAAWRPAKSLIVVTNGALGELPLTASHHKCKQSSAPAEAFFTDVQNPIPRGALEQIIFHSAGGFLYKRSERIMRP